MSDNIARLSPIDTCGSFTIAEKQALRRSLDALSSTKVVTATASYTGAITPLTFQVKSGVTYKALVYVQIATDAIAVTVDLPAVSFLGGFGLNTDHATLASVAVQFTATDPAMTSVGTAGALRFELVFKPSADGRMVVSTGGAASIVVGSHATLEVLS